MATGAALAALSLFVISLQVRAQIHCYCTMTCGDMNEMFRAVPSVEDCCWTGYTITNNSYTYASTDDSSTCHRCIDLLPFVSFPDDCCNNISEKSEKANISITAVLESAAAVCLEVFPNLNCIENSNGTPMDFRETFDCIDIDEPTDDGRYSFTFDIVSDTILEGNEEFCVKIVDVRPNNVTIIVSNKTFTLLDDDSLKIGFTNISYIVNERDEYFLFEVEIKDSGRSEIPIKFTVTDREGDAHRDADYLLLGMPSLLTLEPGIRSMQGNVTIVKDRVLEVYRETFTLHLQPNQTGVTLKDGFNEAIVTIIDGNILEIGFKKTAYSVQEEEDCLLIVVEVKNYVEPEIPVEFNVSVIMGEAREPSDYRVLVTVESLPEDQMVAEYYIILITDDNVLEDTENFTLQLETDQSRVVVLPEFQQTVVTIYDDDTLEIGFSNTTYIVSEGAGYLFFEVGIKNNGSSEIPIHFTVTDSEGDAHRGVDYLELDTLHLVLEPGKPSVQGRVAIVNDSVAEKYQETFTLHLQTNQRNVSVQNGFSSTTVTILDDDNFTISFKQDSYSVSEDSGEVTLTIVAKGELNRSVEVTLCISANHSVCGATDEERNEDDIAYIQQVLSFNDNTSKAVSVTIQNDDVYECNETFFAILSVDDSKEKGVKLFPHRFASITIVNDDGDDDSDKLGVSLWSYALVSESKSPIEVHVIVNGGIICSQVTLNVSTYSFSSEDYAKVHQDYLPFNNMVNLTSGNQVVVINVTVVDDDLYENQYEEIKFHVEVVDSPLSDKIVVTKSNSTATILDNDELGIGFKKDSYSGSKGESEVSLPFEVESDGNSSIPISFTVNVTEGDECNGTVVQSVSLELMPGYKSDLQGVVNVVDDFMAEEIDAYCLYLYSSQPRVHNISGNDTAVVYVTATNKENEDHSYRRPPENAAAKGNVDDQASNPEIKTVTVLTVNDTVFNNGLMTVPINVPEFDSDLYLCYQIHGKHGKYFNFVSDECASVNAHYARVPGASFNIIMDSIAAVAVDDRGNCHRISVDAAGCSVTFDGEAQEVPYEENGISVRSYPSRVRVSVPNCEDNTLVMWVTCQAESFYNPFTNSQMEPIDTIQLEVARGLDLDESSHGLLGQFWNIAVAVTEYDGPRNKLHYSDRDYYVVNVAHPSSPPRSFVGAMHSTSWNFESKQCIFVGSSQGGPTNEVDDANDSVIEGSYKDYITTDPFVAKFKYAVFDDAVCSSG